MGSQQILLYSFVARGTLIVADYTEFTGNFTNIASQYLQNLPVTKNYFTYRSDGLTFNFLVADGFTYCVVAAESVGWQIPMAFLELMNDDFSKRYGGGKAATGVAEGLNKDFGPKLKEHMQYCVDHPDELNKLPKVQARISETKRVLMILCRSECHLPSMAGVNGNLHSQVQDFRLQGTQMRRKMWLQNMRIKLIVLGMIIALILVAVLSVCHGFNCGK